MTDLNFMRRPALLIALALNIFVFTGYSSTSAITALSSTALASTGTISTMDSSASVYVFSGVSVSDNVGFGSFDFDLNHSPVTGQITGEGSVTLENITYEQNYIRTSPDLSGSIKFSAKPVKRGNIVTLAGAKASTVTQGADVVQIYDYGQWYSYDFTFSSNGSFSFSSLSVDTGLQSPQLSGKIAAGRMSVSGKGYYNGRLTKKTVSIPYTAETFSTPVPAENTWHLNIDVSQLSATAKGAVTAYADGLLDASESIPNGYKASGSRNAKTGITKLTFTGVASSTKGTSASVNIGDNYSLQTGKGFSNTLKIYGYSLGF